MESIPPVTLIAARVGLATLLLLLVVAAQGHRLPRSPRLWGALLWQSFLNSIGAWLLVAWGQQYVESGLAGVLNSTSPIFVFFITLLITRHETINARRLAGALLGIAGVVLIIGVDALSGLGQQVIAQLAVLFSALLYAFGAIYGKRFGGLPPSVTAACTLIWASVILVPASLLLEQPWTLRPPTDALLAAAALSVFSTAGALLIYFRLVRTLGSIGVTSQSYLRSGIAVLLGILVLGESFSLPIAFGLAAAVAGVLLINLPGRRTHRF